jgi:hypothetical protein
MPNRVTLYGKPASPDIKRLKREMNVMYVDYDLADPSKDDRARRHLAEVVGEALPLPLVEIQRADGNGSLFLTNPDEPTLRQSLHSEDILSVTAYWV